MLDILFISPNSSKKTYQELSIKYSAIEPPTWALLLAESVRSKGYKTAIVDSLALNLSEEEVYSEVVKHNPRLIVFVVYGQNVNAGTTNMSGAIAQAAHLKERGIEANIGFIGSHVQALPYETLKKFRCIDFVFLNEGVYTISNILKNEAFSIEGLEKVAGLAIRNKKEIKFTGGEKIVPSAELDKELPGYAWDLLPMNNSPLDLYRSPFWHADYLEQFRSPYAALQTSLGCQFKCSFCMINLINKNDDTKQSVASNYSGMRHWSIEFISREIEKLISMGVKTIRIVDEMFLLNKKVYLPIIDRLTELNDKDDLRFWAYSRIDTVPNPEILSRIRKAGIRWLSLGIESGDRKIRLEISKGKFQEVDVERVVKQIENADINVMANYIFGLPNDNLKTIKQTYDLSAGLNTLGWNTYPAIALPGTPLYYSSIENGMKVPENFDEFSFHSKNSIPLENENLTRHQILSLRDDAFNRYFSRDAFLEKVEKKFGLEAVRNIKEMTKINLDRKPN